MKLFVLDIFRKDFNEKQSYRPPVEKNLIIDKNLAEKFTEYMKKYPDLFVVDENEFEVVMEKELEIANICGIPFTREGKILTPITKIDIEVLKVGAPDSLITTLNEVIGKL